MLSPTCWKNHTFRDLLQAEAITPLCVQRISNITCRGSRQRGSFFDEHWTKLNMFNLKGLRVAFYLDSDVVVLRNLDSVVRTMLHRPHLMEARTPQGCLEPHSGLTWFNTGVWAVRPNVSAFDDLLRWLHRGSSVCYDGDQSAAMGFWRIPGGSGRRERREVLTLHVGFNIKADQGPETCMRKRNINQSDLHVVHFSGKQKPFVAQPRKDPTWRLARQSYLSVFGRWESRLGVPACTARQQNSNEGCYV